MVIEQVDYIAVYLNVMIDGRVISIRQLTGFETLKDKVCLDL